MKMSKVELKHSHQVQTQNPMTNRYIKFNILENTITSKITILPYKNIKILGGREFYAIAYKNKDSLRRL